MWWHTVTHGSGSEGEIGEWSGYPVLFTLPRNVVYRALPLLPTPRLPVVYWTDAPAGLNGLVRFAERRSLVSARVPSHLNWLLQRVIVYNGFYPRSLESLTEQRERSFDVTYIHVYAIIYNEITNKCTQFSCFLYIPCIVIQLCNVNQQNAHFSN